MRSRPVARTSVIPAAASTDASRREVLKLGAAASAASVAAPLVAAPSANAGLFGDAPNTDWERIDLPVQTGKNGVVLLDLAFVNDKRGFLLGTQQTLLETNDGGITWEKRDLSALNEEGFNYRFQSVSFKGDEGWIIGKPAILLHTKDAGKTWDRVPLSAKLPGAPVSILATGEGRAELVTDVGAIYTTKDVAYTWQAAVEESMETTLNRTVSSGISGASYYEGTFAGVRRSKDGDYVGVSSRGNFYMSWVPGNTFWFPHNRPSTRRVQAMGFLPDGRMWMTTRAGDVLYAKAPGVDVEDWKAAKIGSRGFGILDIGFKNDTTAYAVGGSGSLFKSTDGGETWARDKTTDDIPANFYAVEFSPNGTGFVLGNDGVLLRTIV